MASDIIKKNLVFFSEKITNFKPVMNHFLQEEIFELSEVTKIENDWKENGVASELFRELLKKELEPKLSQVVEIFKKTGNEHLAKKIEGYTIKITASKVKLEEGRHFKCQSLELYNCEYIKNGDEVELADLSSSIGETVKVLKITCDEGSTVEISLNCLMHSMECIYFRKVRLLIESLIAANRKEMPPRKMEVREIGLDLVKFMQDKSEINVLINDLVNVQGLRKLSLKGKNMSVNVNDLRIGDTDLDETNVVV